MGFTTIPTGTVNTGSTSKDWSKLGWETKNGAAGTGTSTYKSGNYCGPGWGFTYQDILDGRIRDLPKAVDAIDEACKLHDYCYHENGYFTQGCNLVLSYDLMRVVLDKKSTAQQRLDATLMAAYFVIESQTIDLGVLTKNKLIELRDRLLSHISISMMSLDKAIEKEILNRTMSPFPDY